MKASLHILVIDDEPMIGTILSEAFADHTVETFLEPALAIERTKNKHFDIVFCDFMMPGMTGVDVYQALLQTDPELARHFVLMTGSLNAYAVEGFLNAHQVVLLGKPFRLAELQRCISAVAATGD